MSLQLFGHPFSSYTQKVLVALHENDTPFSFRCLSPDHPENMREWQARWPMRQFPLLVDGDQAIPESSVIIEHLQLAHPGPVRLLPGDPQAALAVRALDRFFDLHVMHWVQYAVNAFLSDATDRRQQALERSARELEAAYGWIESRLEGRTWADGEAFTLADCAAAPALFYADWTHRIADRHVRLRAYRARLLARSSFARAVEGGRPFRSFFPLGAPDRD